MRLPLDARWWEFAPEVLLGAGLGLFAITETSAASSAFGSTKALVLMGAVTVGWLAVRVALLRFTRWPTARLVVFAIAALAVLKVVVFPAYNDKTVVEALPVATVVVTVVTTPAPPPTPVTPVAVSTGAIAGIDHRASGTATLYRQPDGSLTIGLEEIDIQPGPDYDVFVVPGAANDDKRGGTRLDDLRGNKGTQYYAVPSGIGLDAGDWTVLVWCQTFDVPVANATLA